MYLKRQEFESAVKKEARKLHWQDITEKIELDLGYFLQRDFKDGQRLDFHIDNYHYQVSVNQEELVVKGVYNVEIKRFRGSRVRRLYNSLSRAILEAKERDLENLPF